MAETSGFYDAEELVGGEYDREYVSNQFAEYFALFIGNGVFASPTNQLKVVAGEGMNIVVKEGWAFIRGRWYHNDADLVIPVPPNTTAATINSGVFVQHSQSDRDTHSILVTGRTTPDREAPYWELKLAELQIPTGTTAITDAMITDTRTDESVCGFVKGLLQGVIPTADLFAQYDAIFMDFYNHMKGQLDEDPAGHLQNEIDDIKDTMVAIEDKTEEEYGDLTEEELMDGTIYNVGDEDEDDAMHAAVVTYDNTESGMDAENVQAAVDELAGDVSKLNTQLIDLTNYNIGTPVSIAVGTPYTCPSDGYIHASGQNGYGFTIVAGYSCYSRADSGVFVPVKKGMTISNLNSQGTCTFLPLVTQ